MKVKRSRWWIVAAFAVLSTQVFAQGANEIVVDGEDWMSATPVERRAFLVGAGNMIIAEAAYAKRNNREVAPVAAGIIKGVDKVTLKDIEARVTRFYEANPSRLKTPVLGVVWSEYVKR